jgi:hypothetical protein
MNIEEKIITLVKEIIETEREAANSGQYSNTQRLRLVESKVERFIELKEPDENIEN